jgi:hypothetical protein
MLVFGSSIGEGNYQPIPNEVIWLQNSSVRLLTNASPASGSAVLNVESLSSGRIGKGIKSLTLTIEGQNTAAVKTLYLGPSASLVSAYLYSQIANIANSMNCTVATDVNGDITIIPADANFSGVYLDVRAIQT